MATNTLSRAPGGMVFRCSVNRTHTRSSRTYSFFDRSNLCLKDKILFIKSYLERNSLAQSARFSGMSYTTTTKEEVEVHTNRIEGAWKHAKDHFRKMSGTKITQFEGHLAEIMWRADVKLDIYEGFFRHLRSVYTLNGPPEYHYPTPLFSTWSGMADSSNSQLLKMYLVNKTIREN